MSSIATVSSPKCHHGHVPDAFEAAAPSWAKGGRGSVAARRLRCSSFCWRRERTMSMRRPTTITIAATDPPTAAPTMHPTPHPVWSTLLTTTGSTPTLVTPLLTAPVVELYTFNNGETTAELRRSCDSAPSDTGDATLRRTTKTSRSEPIEISSIVTSLAGTWNVSDKMLNRAATTPSRLLSNTAFHSEP